MRSSSIKTLFVVVSLTLSCLAAVPSANAKPTQPRPTVTAREPSDIDRAIRAVRRLLTRLLNIDMTEEAFPTIPIPSPGAGAH